MTIAPIAARAAVAEGAGSTVARQGAGKVVDAKVVSSTPLTARRRPSAATSGAAAGAAAGGGGRMFDGGLTGKAAKQVAETVAPTSSARKVLLAEFAACMVVLAFSPLTGKSPSAGAFMKRGSAIMGVFFLLGLVATAGRGASRAAAAFGGLVTLVLLISDRSILVALAKKLGKGVGESDPDDGLAAQDLQDLGEQVGDIVDDLGGQVGDHPAEQLGELGAATADEVADVLGRFRNIGVR